MATKFQVNRRDGNGAQPRLRCTLAGLALQRPVLQRPVLQRRLLQRRLLQRLALALLALALLGLALQGCGPAQVVDEQTLSEKVAAPGLIVLPIALNIPERSGLEVAWRSVDVANWLLVHTDLPLIGPLDFSANKPLDDVLVAGQDTDLGSKEDEWGPEWRTWLALHVLVTENRATNVRDIVDTRVKDKSKPNTYRQHGIEAALRVEVGLYDVRRGTRLAWTVLERTDDPTQYTPGEDPRPGVTAAVKDALQRLVELAPVLLRPAGARRTRGQGLVDGVPALMAFSAPELPSTIESLKTQGDEVKEAKVYAAWDRVAPGLSAVEIRNATLGRGVLVREALPPLNAGDVILSVSGKKVSAIHQVDRLLGLCSPNPDACDVLVRRAGGEVALKLRWPALPAVMPAP